MIALDTQAFAPFYSDAIHGDETLARQLSQAGYETAFFGKSHLGKPTAYGFQHGEELGDDAQSFKQATEYVRSRSDATQPFLSLACTSSTARSALSRTAWLDLYPPGSIHLPMNFWFNRMVKA